ncbi:hypothetical protein QL285_029358 [Trifolium repens]|nr:hypothetical protein QL285_029358 [Trifolium repens]
MTWFVGILSEFLVSLAKYGFLPFSNFTSNFIFSLFIVLLLPSYKLQGYYNCTRNNTCASSPLIAITMPDITISQLPAKTPWTLSLC